MSMDEWVVAHHDVVSVGRARAQHEHTLARALVRALRADCAKALGLGSFYEYSERFAGLTPRQTEERLRVGAAFGDLPELEAALQACLRRLNVHSIRRARASCTSSCSYSCSCSCSLRRARESHDVCLPYFSAPPPRSVGARAAKRRRPSARRLLRDAQARSGGSAKPTGRHHSGTGPSKGCAS